MRRSFLAVVAIAVGLVVVPQTTWAIRLAGVSPGGSSSGAYDLEGEALTCNSPVSLTCPDTTSMIANVNTGGSFDITDGTTTYEFSPNSSRLKLTKGGAAAQLIVENISPDDGVLEFGTIFDFNLAAAQFLVSYGTNEAAISARTATYGYTFGMFQDGILAWSTTATANSSGAQVKQTTAEDGILVRTSTSGYGVVQLTGVAFASLPASPDGTIAWCTDCAKATPCAGSGTGAFAKRMNATWDCD